MTVDANAFLSSFHPSVAFIVRKPRGINAKRSAMNKVVKSTEGRCHNATLMEIMKGGFRRDSPVWIHLLLKRFCDLIRHLLARSFLCKVKAILVF